MSHHIEGFLFNQQETADRFAAFENAIAIPLKQGFVFIPLTDELSDEIGSDDRTPFEAFWKLTGKIEALLKRFSQGSTILYVETDYWGGMGDQSAAIWQNGQLLMKPEKTRIGSINRALRRMGVSKNGAHDEFEAVGLAHFRSNAEALEEI